MTKLHLNQVTQEYPAPCGVNRILDLVTLTLLKKKKIYHWEGKQ